MALGGKPVPLDGYLRIDDDHVLPSGHESSPCPAIGGILS